MDLWSSQRLPDCVAHSADPVVDFPGFGEGAFECLSQLREEPTIERYRALKEPLRCLVMDPFSRYRDDLVINWVLPNGLPFETERNVFSRIPKNDFGAGGANSHLWLSFYRHGRRRLTDLQLAHSISPDGFTVGLYLTKRMHRPYAAFLRMLGERRAEFFHLLQVLADGEHVWDAKFYTTTQRILSSHDLSVADERVLRGVQSVWIRRRVSVDRVVELAGSLVLWAIGGLVQLWPIYRLILDGDDN